MFRKALYDTLINNKQIFTIMNILVFKTNITTRQQVSSVHGLLMAMADIKQYNFDLEDCDNVLRVVSNNLEPKTISSALKVAGFSCEELV